MTFTLLNESKTLTDFFFKEKTLNVLSLELLKCDDDVMLDLEQLLSLLLIRSVAHLNARDN